MDDDEKIDGRRADARDFMRGLGRGPPLFTDLSERTKQQEEANDIDLALFCALGRAETLLTSVRLMDFRRHIIGARVIVRSLMHPMDIDKTRDST